MSDEDPLLISHLQPQPTHPSSTSSSQTSPHKIPLILAVQSFNRATKSPISSVNSIDINIFSIFYTLTNATLFHAPPLMAYPRILLITYPGQSHINPAMQLANRLIRAGAEVTYFLPNFAHRRLTSKPSTTSLNGLSFALFSDGYDDGNKKDDFKKYKSEMKRHGSKALAELIQKRANEGCPFTCLVYTMVLWAAEVAAEFRLPSALLWIQPATVFGAYYYYFHGFGDVIRDKFSIGDDSCSIALPGLPLMSIRDLPSFMDASNFNSSFMQYFEEQFEVLEKDGNQKVLVNTFDELEVAALRAICKNVDLIGIGPLIPSAFLDVKDPSGTSFRADLFQCSNDYMEWLNSKPKGSVVYVSFGSFYVLKKSQREELAKGLLDFGRPFLWVIREKQIKDQNTEEEEAEEELSCREELEKLGKIVSWCSQVEVLSNPTLACFVTHCGWNSSLESLCCGVPMVAFPQWTDQITNAKLIEDVWKIGVRVKANKDGVAEGDEIKRCLELVMEGEEKGVETRRNAEKWKNLAREAAKKGGSSDRNFKAFVDEMIGEAFSSH